MKKGNCRKVSRFLRHPFRGKVLQIPFLFTIRKPVSPHFNKLFFDFSRQTISDSRRGSVARLVLNRFRTFFCVADFCLLCSDTESHILIRCPSALKLKMQLCVHYFCFCCSPMLVVERNVDSMSISEELCLFDSFFFLPN